MSAITSNYRKNNMSNQSNEAFKTNSLNENGIVVCIPRVFKNISKKRIFACMINTGWGQIEKVDLVEGKSFNKAFVHYVPNKFNVSMEHPRQALNRMKKGEQVIFTYDVNKDHPEGWFWKIGISKSIRPKFRESKPRMDYRRKRTLDLSGKNTKVKINDADLLLRKNVNQKVISEEITEDGTQYSLKGPYGEISKIEFQAYRVGDDPIMARALQNNNTRRPVIKKQYTLHPSQLY